MSDAKNNAYYAKSQSRAGEYADNPQKLAALALSASAKAGVGTESVFGSMWNYLTAMMRLIAAYADGSYRRVPVQSLLTIIAAVAYFVSPIDLIPDFIIGLGLIDDAGVVSLAVASVRQDLDDFMAWERERI